MEGIESSSTLVLTQHVATSIALGAFSLCLLWLFVRRSGILHTNKRAKLPPVPGVPGCLPVVGNLLQFKEKKPHKTFAKMAEKYGPIYSIKQGAVTLIVLNTAELAKEALVTRFASISIKKLSSALKILSRNRCMVVMSNYDDFHKMIKKHIVTNVLGANAQKQHRSHRDVMMENLSRKFGEHAKNLCNSPVNFRHIFATELFGLALKQTLGSDVEFIYVEELGVSFSKEELFKILVVDNVDGASEVDWRDFFPYLKWIPNNSLETKIHNVYVRRMAVMKALMKAEKKRLALGRKVNCYFDYLMSEVKDVISEEEITMILWEPIVQTSDSTILTTEWAFYQLAKDKKRQDRLYEEIHKVCGNEKVTENHLSKLPYLSAVFHETLRKHNPVTILPLRYVHEDTELGGYHVPAGCEIAINLYACHMDRKKWEKPEEWMPERFLDGKYNPMDLYNTLAFGGGKRVCAGSLQATLVSCTAIGRLVQEFEWELGQGEEENVDPNGFTSHKLHPLFVKVKPRKL